MLCFADLDKVLGHAYEGRGNVNVDARRLSPPLTLAVTCCVALGELLGPSESLLSRVCSKGLNWMAFISSSSETQ